MVVLLTDSCVVYCSSEDGGKGVVVNEAVGE